MEEKKTSFVRDGFLKLPPGFRFHPTDEELVVQYLKRKCFAFPLPANIIPVVDLAKHNPWDLPGGSSEERYFFSLREAKYPNGGRSNRATGCGYWKATGKDKAVVGSRGNQVVGMKKVLVFYRGNPRTGSRTGWVMHEYRLAGAGAAVDGAGDRHFIHRDNSTNNSPARDWVLCRIFMKKRGGKMDLRDRGIGSYNFNRYADHLPSNSSTSSASDSSCVTDLSDESTSGEETSSISINSSP